MNWADVRADMAWDGAWRDIYTSQADAEAWATVLGVLPSSGYGLTFERDECRGDLPTTFAKAGSRDGAALLMIDLGGIRAACHFFYEEMIEFDIDPREIGGDEAFEHVFRFMQRLDDLLRREVVSTHESQPDAVITIYRPN